MEVSLRCSTSPIATASPSGASTAHQANFHGRLPGKQSERTILWERVLVSSCGSCDSNGMLHKPWMSWNILD